MKDNKRFNLLELMAEHKLQPNKNLGQHFLKDQLWCERMLSGLELTSAKVLEIGPGPGILTSLLLDKPLANLTIIEKDSKFIPLLESLPNNFNINLNICLNDALKLLPTDIVEDYNYLNNLISNFNESDKLIVVGNLPYNIGTELLIRLANLRKFISSITVMLQLEVVERIIAQPGTKHYGRLAILLQCLFNCEFLFEVPASAFIPPPKVTSAVIRLFPKQINYSNALLKNLSVVTQTAFCKRRKMIRGSLKLLFPNNWPEIISEVNILETMRPEELSVANFMQLAGLLDQ